MTRKKHSRLEERSDGGVAFLPDPAVGPVLANDALAESLGKEYLTSATSGEESTPDDLDRALPEEVGGPFVLTTSDDELSLESDEEDEEGEGDAEEEEAEEEEKGD